VIQQLVNVEAGFEYDGLEGGAKVWVEHQRYLGRDPLQKTARSALLVALEQVARSITK